MDHGHRSRDRTDQRAFVGVSALLFASSAALTAVWCASTSRMGGMPMHGARTMSMAWAPTPGQPWLGAASSFLGMWTVMMVAMMLPCLFPSLWRYREAIGQSRRTRLAWPTALVGVGYFVVWTAVGVAVFPLSVSVAAIETRLPAPARALPIAVGVVVLVAGALQFTRWKAHHLACCRLAPGAVHVPSVDARAAWRYGVRLGLHCCCCTANLMAILVVLGMMDLRTMAAVTAAMAAERVAPAGERVAHVIGVIAVGVGLILVAGGSGVG